MNVSRNTNGVPVIDLTTTDLNGPQPAGFTAAIDQLAAGALRRTTPDLPTEPGLYAVYGGDSWSASVFALDESGFWWRLGHTDITADEVAAFAGTHPLERLIRHTEADQ